MLRANGYKLILGTKERRSRKTVIVIHHGSRFYTFQIFYRQLRKSKRININPYSLIKDLNIKIEFNESRWHAEINKHVIV